MSELDRVFQTPYDGTPIGERWRAGDRTWLLDVWWALYLGAAVGRVASFLFSGGRSLGAAEELAQTARWDGFGSLFGAAAGIAFLLIVRRILASSNRSGVT